MLGKLGISPVWSQEQGSFVITGAELIDSTEKIVYCTGFILERQDGRVCATCITEGE